MSYHNTLLPFEGGNDWASHVDPPCSLSAPPPSHHPSSAVCNYRECLMISVVFSSVKADICRKILSFWKLAKDKHRILKLSFASFVWYFCALFQCFVWYFCALFQCFVIYFCALFQCFAWYFCALLQCFVWYFCALFQCFVWYFCALFQGFVW